MTGMSIARRSWFGMSAGIKEGEVIEGRFGSFHCWREPPFAQAFPSLGNVHESEAQAEG